MVRTYYALTKPGIILGNILTMFGGFALASKGMIDYWLFLATLIGLAGVIASACVFNNYIDREADKKMERTKNRPLAQGLITSFQAILFAIILLVAGTLTLVFYTNLLTVVVALIGFFVYVVLYSVWKYRTVNGTLIGSISGGVPPVVGYCAASNHFDVAALILFLIVVLWQMPHFFAIAMYRFDDYKAASIPVLPVKKGMRVTKIQMLLYIIAFILTTMMLIPLGYTGTIYFIVAALCGLAWLGLCVKGLKSSTTSEDKLWARKMFICSLGIILALCITMSVDTIS